jgi:ketosteroid isomerase-like protein
MADKYITEMYQLIDSMDTDKFCELFDENGSFKFANMPAVTGKANVHEFIANFFNSIKAINHDQLESWQVDGARFAIGRVKYTRHNDTHLEVPFSVVLKMNGELVKDYLVYVDASELYA